MECIRPSTVTVQFLHSRERSDVSATLYSRQRVSLACERWGLKAARARPTFGTKGSAEGMPTGRLCCKHSQLHTFRIVMWRPRSLLTLDLWPNEWSRAPQAVRVIAVVVAEVCGSMAVMHRLPQYDPLTAFTRCSELASVGKHKLVLHPIDAGARKMHRRY